MKPREVVVIKIGSNALVDESGLLDGKFLKKICQQVARLLEDHWQPVIVSSGAVACGMGLIGKSGAGPKVLAKRQALAAIGQADLMHRWQRGLAAYGALGAQMLLNAGDFNDRERYLNLQASMRALFEYKAVPIINENDVVSIEELTLGDNDRLSAIVASQLGARFLFLLTDVDGVYDADPRKVASASRIQEMDVVTDAHIASAGGSGIRGTGGMQSKLRAAQLAARAGVETVIARARDTRIIERALSGESVGTRVAAGQGNDPSSRRRWLALARTCRGQVVIDDGAAKALVSKGKSLLSVGVVEVSGAFNRGDTVAIVNRAGEELARGLASLSADDLKEIIGLKWADAVRQLGHAIPKNAIHRDNILLHVD